MTIRFRYAQTDLPDGTKITVPKIPLILVGKNKRLRVLGLLDTGSTQCYIRKDLAEILNLTLSDELKTDVTTIGQKIAAWETRMKIIVEGTHGAIHEITVPVGVMPNEKLDEIIIGREAFFDAFDITFAERRKRILLKPHNIR